MNVKSYYVSITIIILMSLISCINLDVLPIKETKSIVGDCFNDSLLLDFDLKMKSLGWQQVKKSKHEAIDTLIYNKKYLYESQINESVNFNTIEWELVVIDNKFIATNYLYHDSNKYLKEFMNLQTHKQDTLFWNVVNLLDKYCELRDSSYYHFTETNVNEK